MVRGQKQMRRAQAKAEKRAAIMTAAEALLTAVGCDAFSMMGVAERAGVAKGTLYLYFESREELLLALYLELRGRADARLAAGLRVGMSDAELIDHYLETMLADPNLLELRVRLTSVIDQNVSPERYIDAKRRMREGFETSAPLIEEACDLHEGAGLHVMIGFRALLIGASQLYTDPALDPADLPDDVKVFATTYSPSKVFRAYAPSLLAGIRAGG